MINKTDMETRRIEHTNTLTEKPERVFAILHTPSAIRAWWGASRVIVLPYEKGVWAAVWGNEEDAPDYLAASTIRVFDPLRRLVLGIVRKCTEQDMDDLRAVAEATVRTV